MEENIMNVDYNYDYSSSQAGAASFVGAFFAAYFLFIIIALALYVLGVIANWKLLSRMGEPGYAALTSTTTSFAYFKVLYGNGWLFLIQLLICCAPIINIFVSIKLGRAFGKSTGFIVGLCLLPTIFRLILAFSDAEFQGVKDTKSLV